MNRFGLVHAAELATPLDQYSKRLHVASFDQPLTFDKGMPSEWAAPLSGVIESVVVCLRSEGRKVQLAELKSSAVSQRLRDFGQGNLTPEQEALKSETIRCLEIEAYRAAMVLGWNLAYDRVRRWIFDKKLAEFNVVLTTKERKKGEFYAAVSGYSDFFVLGERDVLNWSLQAAVFNDKVHRALVERLDRRNDYAHANFKHPDFTQALGYIHELLTTIEDQPFTPAK